MSFSIFVFTTIILFLFTSSYSTAPSQCVTRNAGTCDNDKKNVAII